MNTIGKILVILNFLFAIIVGLLLIFDFAARNRWKEAYFAREQEAKTLESVYKLNLQTQEKLAVDVQTAGAKIEEIAQKLKDEQDKATVTENAYKIEKDDLRNQVDNAKLALMETVKAKERLTNEIAHLNTVIKDRETAIVKFEQDIKRFRNDAVQYEGLYKTATIQNQNLLEQLREANLALAKLQAGVGVADVAGASKDPNAPNPPAVKVNGKIEKVDGTDLVLLTVGTDHGVAKGNTLDVYRTAPTAKYLGMVRIIDANHHSSVARLIPSGNAQFRPKLVEGDLVTSNLSTK